MKKRTFTGTLLIVVAGLFTTLCLNPTLIESSSAQLGGQSLEPTGPNIVTSGETQETEDTESKNETAKNETASSRQADVQQSNFCLKGTGPGTDKPCAPCNPTSPAPGESECTVFPQGGTTSKKELKLPQTFYSWFKSGIQELEKEKTIPPGTGNALASLQNADQNTLSKLCKAISKDPNADIKPADCNSLQGKNAEEIKWIMAGWTVGKLQENADNDTNDTSSSSP